MRQSTKVVLPDGMITISKLPMRQSTNNEEGNIAE